MGTNVLLPENSRQITRGTDKSFRLAVVDQREESITSCGCDKDSPPPLDLTGAVIHFTVKKEVSDRLPLIKKSSANPSEIEIVNAKAGLANIHLIPADTQFLEPDFYVFDVWVVLSNGKRFKVTGPCQLQIEAGVTLLPI